jgi:hypothetical protein
MTDHHRLASPELEAQLNDALGLVELPPIRVTKELHAALLAACERSGQIIQAEVRDMLMLGTRIVAGLPPLPPKAAPPVTFIPPEYRSGQAPRVHAGKIEARARQLYVDDTGPTGFLATMVSFYRLPLQVQQGWVDRAREGL